MNQMRVDALMRGHDATLKVSNNLLRDAINSVFLDMDVREIVKDGGVVYGVKGVLPRDIIDERL